MKPIRYLIVLVTLIILFSCDDNENKTILVPGEIAISPATGLVCAGNAIQFTCTYDTTIGDIEWKVIGPGTITASGHYFLPDTLGTDSAIIRVVVQYKKFPDVSDTATLIGYTNKIRMFVTELTGYSAYHLPFIRTSSGDYIITGAQQIGGSNFLLKRFDSLGRAESTFSPGKGSGQDIMEYAAHDYAATGSILNTGNQKFYVAYVRFTEDYFLDTKMYFPGTGYSICKALDEGFYISGNDSLGQFIMKINSQGDFVWKSNFTLGGHESVIRQSPDGSLYLTALKGNNSSYANNCVLKTNADGDSIWVKELGQGTKSGSLIVIDENTILYATTVLNSWWDFQLTKLNSSGEIIWNKNYDNNSGIDVLYGFNKTIEGGYILVGYTNHKGYIIKVDADGNKVFERTYETGYVLNVLSEPNGFVFSGLMQKHILYRSDKNGSLRCEELPE